MVARQVQPIRPLQRAITWVSLFYLGMILLCAVFAEQIAPYSPTDQDLLRTWATPDSNHLLGTDGLGRDILSRLIIGTRISLTVAVLASLLVMVIGVPLGLISGYKGGIWDAIIMRLVDTLYAFPDVLLVIVLSAVFKANLLQGTLVIGDMLREADNFLSGTLGILIALSLTTWPPVCRIVRAQVLSVRELDFVIATRALGASESRILWRHIFPNVIGNVLTAVTLVVPRAILTEAGLSFLGLGVDPPAPSWGRMIAEGALAMRAHPHMLIASTLMLIFTLLALMILSDKIRVHFDPTTSIVN